MTEPPIVLVIETLHKMGFFQFYLPFLLTAAIFYALLRKSQIFGPPERNVATNAVVAVGAAFFVWSAPILLGIDVTQHLVLFFLQALGTMLVFVIGLLLISTILPPDLPKQLSEKIKAGWPWGLLVIAGLLIGGLVLGTSGLLFALFRVTWPGLVEIPAEVGWTIVLVSVMLISVVAIILLSK